jgi:hypothetical protein
MIALGGPVNVRMWAWDRRYRKGGLMKLTGRIVRAGAAGSADSGRASTPAVKPAELPKEVHTAYLEELSPAERAALLSWAGFAGTFAAVRGITYSIRNGKGPFHNVSAGTVHLHHYLWGIAMLGGVGAVAVHGSDERRRHPGVALSYGVGLALIVDEFALLLDLQDVYWTKQGRLSLNVGIGMVAAGGTVFAGLPVLQRLVRNRRMHARREHESTAVAGTRST